MKKRLLLLMVACCLSAGVHAQQMQNAVIKFAVYSYNVGHFSKSHRPRRGAAFKFWNTGNADLIIHDVDPLCGCLSVQWPRHPIPPGGSGYVTVIYEGRDQLPHYFNKMVCVNTNSNTTKHVRLSLEGEMTE